MEVKIRHLDTKPRISEESLETDSIRIKLHGNEYLLQQAANGLQITEVTDDCIMVCPRTANSITIITRDNEHTKQKA